MTDVRDQLIEEIAKTMAIGFDYPEIWGDYLNTAAAIVDALGLVTDRRLRVLTEEGWSVYCADTETRVWSWFCPDGPAEGDPLTAGMEGTLEAAVASAWEARGS